MPLHEKSYKNLKQKSCLRLFFSIKQIPNGKIVLTYGDGHTEEVSINTVLA